MVRLASYAAVLLFGPAAGIGWLDTSCGALGGYTDHRRVIRWPVVLIHSPGDPVACRARSFVRRPVVLMPDRQGGFIAGLFEASVVRGLPVVRFPGWLICRRLALVVVIIAR